MGHRGEDLDHEPRLRLGRPDEQERQAQVRNWKRLLEIADALEVH